MSKVVKVIYTMQCKYPRGYMNLCEITHENWKVIYQSGYECYFVDKLSLPKKVKKFINERFSCKQHEGYGTRYITKVYVYKECEMKWIYIH
jgi:hypothetical protein